MTFFRGGSSNTDTNRFGGGGGRVLFRFLALAIDLLQHVVHRRTLNLTGGVITVCVESLLQNLIENNTQFLSHCKQCFFIYLSIAVAPSRHLPTCNGSFYGKANLVNCDPVVLKVSSALCVNLFYLLLGE